MKQKESRQREQRNEKRRVEWENDCKIVETKGPTVDRIPWDEADLKVKSFIYLSLRAEACRTFHQKNAHKKLIGARQTHLTDSSCSRHNNNRMKTLRPSIVGFER